MINGMLPEIRVYSEKRFTQNIVGGCISLTRRQPHLLGVILKEMKT